MRTFKTVLVLLIAVVISHGHPLSKSEVEDDKELPSSSVEPEKVSSEKEKPDLKPKPEDSNVDLKPETPVSEFKPQLDAVTPVIPETLNPCSSVSKDCGIKPDFDLERRNNEYDQRQNGTENYRIQVDGLVVVVAPVEALLLAGGAAGSEGSNLSGQPNMTALLSSSSLKASDEHSQSQHLSPLYYSAPKPEGPVSIKLINLIAPLLEQRRHLGL